MSRIRHYIDLEKAYLYLGVYTLKEYPLDSIIWIISIILREITGFIGVLLIARSLDGINGWDFYAICVLFSMAMLTESLGQSFVDSVWSIGSHVRKGKFDTYLTRPAPVLMQLLGSRCNFQAMSTFTMALVILIYGWEHIGIPLTICNILFVLEFIICGTILNTSIYLAFNSLNFWLVNSGNVAELALTFRQFSKYPLSIFPKLIIGVMTYMIPFGFVGFYPASYLMGKTDWNVPVLLPIVMLIVASAAGLIWRTGMKGYNSTGT